MNAKTRSSRWFRRAAIGVAGLLVLAVVLTTIADGHRRMWMKTERTRLLMALDRVDAEILKGQTPHQWHASRIKGSNGWEHLAFVFDADRLSSEWHNEHYDAAANKPEFVELAETLSALASYFEDDWEQDNPDDPDGDPITTPPDALVDRWLAVTDPAAAAFAKAATCDTVVQSLGDDEPYPAGIRVIPRINAAKAMLARCRILLDRGEKARALDELRNFVAVSSKFDAPICWVDCMVHLGVWGRAIEFARELLVDERITPAEAREFLTWNPDVYPKIRAISEGEAVWLYAGAKAAVYAVNEPAMFDWITGDVPGGSGLFGEDDQFKSLRTRYFGPGNLTHEIALGIESAVAWVEISRTPPPWDPSGLPEAELSELFATYPSQVFGLRNRVVKQSLKWLELELRIIELEHGPFHQRKDAVAAIVARYPGARHGWEDDRLALGIDMELLRLEAEAKARDPEAGTDPHIEMLRQHFARDDDHDDWNEDNWETWLFPLDELRRENDED
jgi:hypothetical protein